ncbi:uncharacterized protein LOC131883735 isoform X4 [Tigriopus californicus]|nr:uncharacterized protein LOC131883735 isoform X4 [Tigriopus californicus]XP_059087258.1 uncharacterized protein LOC131883735 isoform X4 [Tigriopus californicus]XP_059087259.1 uncharacterized protein LOC131883735 isoform X4 [Tigriopus californicus]XP_059087260.1 uncharacterized protein LOC131883735 isoform X4 [Tigriopus californicus]|eukprot:TCALIF_09720-PA protein Name:"Protein of unknown function" AED:0.00 eAED:0.00 QI:517/1/1/1/1/1/2/1253/162
MNNAINKIPLHFMAMTSMGLGVFVLGFGYITKRETALNFAREPYYQNSIRHLRRHDGATFVLGVPIIDQKMTLSQDQVFRKTDNSFKIETPVKGPTGSGIYHVLAMKNPEGTEWQVEHSSLELHNTTAANIPSDYKNKRMTIYDRSKDGELPDYLSESKKRK